MAKKAIKKETTFGDEVLHSLSDFFGAVEAGEPITIRKVKLDLHPEPYGPDDVRDLRRRLGVSQALFAELIAVSVDLVQKWEGGTREPQAVHCRLFDEIARDPKAWLNRIVEMAEARAGRRASA